MVQSLLLIFYAFYSSKFISSQIQMLIYYEPVLHNKNKPENCHIIIYQHLINKCQPYYNLIYF